MGATEEKKKKFFETAAGIITGITALIVAITGFIAVLNSSGCFGKQGPDKPIIDSPAIARKQVIDTPATTKKQSFNNTGSKKPQADHSYEGSYTGSTVSNTVPRFGGGKTPSGQQFCFYSCTFDNLILSINLDESNSDFRSTYSENVLDNCPSSDKLETQKFTAKKTSFDAGRSNRRITIGYTFVISNRIGHTATFTGKFYDDRTIKGHLVINRKDFNGFQGYTFNIPLTLHKE